MGDFCCITMKMRYFHAFLWLESVSLVAVEVLLFPQQLHRYDYR